MWKKKPPYLHKKYTPQQPLEDDELAGLVPKGTFQQQSSPAQSNVHVVVSAAVITEK